MYEFKTLQVPERRGDGVLSDWTHLDQALNGWAREGWEVTGMTTLSGFLIILLRREVDTG